MAAEIALVWNRPSDRLWLPRLRQWTTANGPLLKKLRIKAPVQPFNCPGAALRWRAELPNERLVVTSGFSRSDIEVSQNCAISSGEPVIVRSPDAIEATT